ncbi:MAG TPA: DUF885 family protein, partial [bacterium]|nr:DUF885 family protein [bacterium]
MRRRDLLRSSLLALAAGCAPRPRAAGSTAPAPAPADRRFESLRDRYFLKILALYPVVSTYLGGDGYSPELARTNAALRDWSPEGVAAELSFLKAVRAELGAVPAANLSPVNRIDHAVVTAQVAYLLHMLEETRWQERSVETYTQEPFRGLDFHMQQMPEQGQARGKTMLGTKEDWDLLVARVGEVPLYFERARANLLAGKRAGNLPDRRMVKSDGIESLDASVDYFRTELPAKAKELLGDRPFAAATLAALVEAGTKASTASAAFSKFLGETFDLDEKTDRYA